MPNQDRWRLEFLLLDKVVNAFYDIGNRQLREPLSIPWMIRIMPRQ